MSRAVFLDRDGVLVIPEFRDGRSFAPRRLEDYHFYPEAASALIRLKAADHRLIVVTNQPDVGNGLTARVVVDEMHHRLQQAMPIDAIMACFHAQTEACDCRKPKPGMLIDAAKQFRIDVAASFMVGDRASDIEAGAAAGCGTIFIDRGYEEHQSIAPTFMAKDIADAADFILGKRTPKQEETPCPAFKTSR
jgi:D-glycero-D-manno-heptose 1,7-bisphosphate phosphatase